MPTGRGWRPDRRRAGRRQDTAAAPRETRRPDPVPTTEAPPPPPPPPPPTTVIVQVPRPLRRLRRPRRAPAGILGEQTDRRSLLVQHRGEAAPLTAPPSRHRHPPPAPDMPPADGFCGVAPDVELISIRQSSKAFSPKNCVRRTRIRRPGARPETSPRWRRAIVHAANMGAEVINISQVSCMSALNVIDQRDWARRSATPPSTKTSVIVAAAGNTANTDCKQNPIYNPLTPNDPSRLGRCHHGGDAGVVLRLCAHRGRGRPTAHR